VDNSGHLVPVTKVRGRKTSLNELVSHMEETAIDPKNQTVYISHGDCEKDAQYVAELIKNKFGTSDILIDFVEPVIGAHSGPGTVALFFLGSQR
jgi:fatty acid-binding protein DegV